MRINNIAALNYEFIGNRLNLHLTNTNLDEISGMDTSLLTVKTDAGDVVETIAGYMLCSVVCSELDDSYKAVLVQNIEEFRAIKMQEIGDACTAAIYAGVEVGSKRYSLTEHDQIELMAQQSAVLSGAVAVPYHADGELCRMYPADEFIVIAQSATAHIFYHRTYFNHLNVWIRRAEDTGELQAISYGAELPEDLAANMTALLAAAGGSQ